MKKSPLFMTAQLPFNVQETVKLNKPMIKMMDDSYNKVLACRNFKELKIWNRILASGTKLLEIGCGSGYLLHALYEQGQGCYYGLEPISSEYRKCRQQLRPLFRQKKIPLKELDRRVKNSTLEKITFKNIKFDYIYSYHVFEHLVNPLLMLAYARKLLSKHGKLVIVTPNVEGALPARDISSWRCSLSSHRWLPGKTTLIRALEHSGFKINKFFTYGGYPAPRGFLKNMANLWFKIRNKGDVICIMGEK
ncbi:MAG TPA: class I SAM-dependent methyltransferase [Spirochaetota bacterium]|nr:class I SAM-dependent methyltransferase [Spirochaetota bacterium]